MYGPKIFRGQFSRKFKKSLKIYLLLHFSSNLLQIFRKCSLHYKKKTLLVNFYKLYNSILYYNIIYIYIINYIKINL